MFLYHPPSSITWLSVSVTAGAPVQIVATSTPCRGIWIGRKTGAAVDFLVGDASIQPLRIPADGNVAFIPIDDASKIWVDIASGTGAFKCGIIV
jgi:hypothetical protein